MNSRQSTDPAAAPATPPTASVEVAELIAALRNGERSARESAAVVLGRMGTAADAAVPALVAALRDDDLGVSGEAECALGRIGLAAVPALVAILQDEGVPADVRARAADAFRWMGALAADAIPVLTACLRDATVRSSAGRALATAGRSAMPALVSSLRDKEVGVRLEAAAALGRIGRSARAAVPALIATLWDDDADVRYHAAAALGRIGRSTAVRALADALTDKAEFVRAAAAGALGEIGPRAVAAVPSLILSLRDPDAGVQEAAAEALEEIGPLAGPVDRAAVPALLSAIKDMDNWAREVAEVAIGKIGLTGLSELAVPRGLERMSLERLAEVRSALAVFAQIGEWCELHAPDTWQFKIIHLVGVVKWPDGKPVSDSTMGRALKEVGVIFRDYFKDFVGVGDLAADDDLSAPPENKLFLRWQEGAKKKFLQICAPFGRRAFALARDYLQRNPITT
jgi:HEAT repeat protein